MYSCPTSDTVTGLEKLHADACSLYCTHTHTHNSFTLPHTRSYSVIRSRAFGNFTLMPLLDLMNHHPESRLAPTLMADGLFFLMTKNSNHELVFCEKYNDNGPPPGVSRLAPTLMADGPFSLYVCVCVCERERERESARERQRESVCTYMYVCIYTCIYVHAYVCMYIYTYEGTHTHTHTHTHTRIIYACINSVFSP
jgi:hypothetical protein